MQTSEVLNKAADLIEERGWGKGPLAMSGEHGLCLEGAIFAAAFGRRAGGEGDTPYMAVQECPAGRAVYAYLQPRMAGTGNTYAWGWNDDQQYAAPVIEVLRAAALIEAARENAETRQAVSA